MEEIVGAQARRDIRAGELLTDAAVIVPLLVKSGDVVRVSVSAGAVQVTGIGRASGSGRVGDLIRVLMPSSRRGLKARITGPGSVEIVR
jgi:flagella basal body P-ring formation protein FlgA